MTARAATKMKNKIYYTKIKKLNVRGKGEAKKKKE